MNTKVVKLNYNNLDKEAIEEAGYILRKGGLVAFPTETVYGLGANALNDKAVKKIFDAKGRPQDNPLIVHIAEVSDIEPLVEKVPEVALKFIKKFWPGSLTIILPKSNKIPDATSAGLDSIGIRMPSNEVAREIIKASGVPIAAPSANISGRPSPTDLERCVEDLNGKVDYIIGGEKSNIGVESTIIDCTVYPPCILRPGAVTLEMLREVEKEVYIDPGIMKKPEEKLKPKAPGMKYRHYAPKAPVKVIQGDIVSTTKKINELIDEYVKEDKVVGVMATDETLRSYPKALVESLGSRNNINMIAQNLFETLRKFDDKNVDVILSEAFEEKGIGIAVMNRLKKSAGFDIISI